MIATIVGMLVFLFGAAVASNAAFSERAMQGAVIAFFGICIIGGGIAEIIIQYFWPL